VQHLHSLQQLLRRQATQRSPPRHWAVSRILDSSSVVWRRGPARRCITPPGCRPSRRVSRREWSTARRRPAVRVSYKLRLWRRPGLAPPWVVAGTSWAERRGVFEQKTTRRELELVRDARPGRALPARRRSGAASRRPVEPRRTRHRRRCRSLEPRAFASQPPAPGWAAVRPARIADLGVPTPPREGVNAATPTTATRGEGCPGSTSGSGLYQQLYLQRRPARCLNPAG
jgi:hypothetical protein